MIHKVSYIRRAPGIGDYNVLVDAINYLIDKVGERREVVPITISREVKDFSFFHWNETSLPYNYNYIIVTPEDATNIFKEYALTYKETSSINDAIVKWKIVALEINVTELVVQKEKKQDILVGYVKNVDLDAPVKEEPKKKKERKKKSSWK